jgi:putative exporter of polyketide antibiotics
MQMLNCSLQEMADIFKSFYCLGLVKSRTMANISTARKLGIAVRIAGQQVKRSRTYGALLSGARATISHFAGILHQLWLEITGFVFLAFASVGAIAIVREYGAYHAGRGNTGHLAAAAVFFLMFTWFGVSSFWRVRKRR